MKAAMIVKGFTLDAIADDSLRLPSKTTNHLM
jgi:hypothetical protein